jgi:serine/threonine protein kinase
VTDVTQCYQLCARLCVACSHNVLITDDCRAVLTDFGMSKTSSTISGMTNTKSVFNGGTLAWTAPEIFNARRGASNFTAKSDVFSYGIVIYEVLSGAQQQQQSTAPAATAAHRRSKEVSSIPWYVCEVFQIHPSITFSIDQFIVQ